jgi:Family of unknown function (DUF6502)
MSTSGPTRSGATGNPSGGRPLDAAVLEAIHHVSRVMIVRCGYDAGAVNVAFARAVAACSDDLPTAPPLMREIPEASHIVTLWGSNIDYVDEGGKPLPLPLRGKGRSIQALASQTNPALDLDELLQYLLRTNTVEQIGDAYVLRQKWVMLRGIPGSAHGRSIRGLLGVLRTFEHNLLADSDSRSWFEFMAENPHFPVTKLGPFDKLLRRLGLAMLRKLDGYMRHCEKHRDPDEPTVWLGVGTYRFQHDESTVSSSSGKTRSRPEEKSPDSEDST